MNELYIIAACVITTAIVFYNIGKAVGFDVCAGLFSEFTARIYELVSEEMDEEEFD